MFSKAIITLLLFLGVASPVAHGILVCQNGGTYDRGLNMCFCSPHYHGALCELSFAASNPCSGISLPVLRDRFGVHRLGNHEVCDSSPNQTCTDFTVIRTGWYRLDSPAGSYLVDRCPRKTVDCGSYTPYLLADKEQEANFNLRLFKAKAFRYRSTLVNGCYISTDTSYPVRILECSPYLTLYYLTPLPKKHHFCIGDKKRCPPGTISADGTGFEPCSSIEHCSPRLIDNAVAPKLRLEYEITNPSKTDRSWYEGSFHCDVFPIFKSNWSGIDGVRYQVDFKLTLRNGTTMSVPECLRSDQIIEYGKRSTFKCESHELLKSDVNVYGGSLLCRVQARCNGTNHDYNSAIVASNSHGFFFTHWFQNQTDVIKPDEPVTLCVSSKNIPVSGSVIFRVSIGRRQIIPNDKIDVSVVRRDSNESCKYEMRNNVWENKQICVDLTLHNHDPDNRITLGLQKADQISVIKVKIYYSSSADGLSTWQPNGTLFNQEIHDIEMKVDLTRLMTRVTTFLHVYFDPFVKPANRDYYGAFQIFPPNERHFMLVKHKLLPYEIQGTIIGNFVTDITIRYVYDVIHIYGSAYTKTLTHRIIPKRLPPHVRDPLKKKPDGLPFGVTLTRTPQVIKVQFDLYGTILYIWGFRTGTQGCANKFVMENKIMTHQSCSGLVHTHGSKVALDVMLVPGFYDTPNHTEGMLFTSTTPIPISNSRDALLDIYYEMKPIQAVNSQIRPTEVLQICTCSGTSGDDLKSNCFVSIDNIKPSQEQLPQQTMRQLQLLREPSKQSAATSGLKISEQEAEEMCKKFIQMQLSKSASTEICSSRTGPVGEANYISQFESLCVSYATTLGTYKFSQSLFNSILGMCYIDLTYNATVVLGNFTQIETILENLCPANCSNRGVCISGECSCDEGYLGASCELELSKIEELPTEISLLQQNVFCPSNGCSAVYLTVKPFLKSEDCVCNILLDSRHKFTVLARFISGDIVMCDLKNQHDWLYDSARVYVLLQITISAEKWESTNKIDLLLHRSICGGRPVVCDATSMSCRVGVVTAGGPQLLDPSVEVQICLFSDLKASRSGPDSAATSLLVSKSVVLTMSWLLISVRILLKI